MRMLDKLVSGQLMIQTHDLQIPGQVLSPCGPQERMGCSVGVVLGT